MLHFFSRAFGAGLILAMPLAVGCSGAADDTATPQDGTDAADAQEGGSFDDAQDSGTTTTTLPVDSGTLGDSVVTHDDTAVVEDTNKPEDGGTVVTGGVRFLGRVDASDPRAVKFAWSNSGFTATVTGTKISVKLQGVGSAAFYQPVVDGKPGARFSVASGATQTVVIGDSLSAADHTVEVYRDTEGMYGHSVFLGFVDGTVKGSPPSSGRLLEIVGDSISAGYGNLGHEVHPPWDNTCSFTLDTQSAYDSYAGKLGRSLNAEVSVLARSGWGMYRDLGGLTSGVLSSVYDNAVGTDGTWKWSFARKPNAVLIDLGTNDSGKGDPGKPYEDAYVAFLKTVRGHYPDAWIFLTIGPMTGDPLLTTMRTHLKNVVTAAADAKVKTIDIPVQDTSTTGCDYHPDVAEDQKMADALAPTIKSQLGW